MGWVILAECPWAVVERGLKPEWGMPGRMVGVSSSWSDCLSWAVCRALGLTGIN